MKWRGLEDKPAGEAGVPLSVRLRERRELISQYVPQETQQATRQVVTELAAAGIAEASAAVGSAAPAFALPDHDGKIVASEDLLKKGRLAVIFFRGRWCPFCVAQLESTNEFLQQIREAGAELVAISPQKVHQSSLMRDQHLLRFPVLSDAGNQVARSFGLAYKVPGYQQKIYSRTFVNLPFINGDSSWELPIPASFVIGGDGQILWRYVQPDYTERPEPAEILEALLR